MKEKLAFEKNLSDSLLTAAEVVAEFPVFLKPFFERDRSERLVVRVLPPGRSMSVSIVGDDGSSFLDAEGNLLDAESSVV